MSGNDMKRQGAERLQEAIGLISDEYIEEAHQVAAGEAAQAVKADEADARSVDAAKILQLEPRKRRTWGAKPLAIAACLAVALGVGALTFANMPKPMAEDTAEVAAVSEDATGKTDEAGSASGETDMLMTEPMAGESVDGETGYGEAGAADGYNHAPGHQRPDRPEGEANVLTAGEWNDNDNWDFFMGLVYSQAVDFPVFGIDPANRVKVTVVDAAGNPVRGERVVLLDRQGEELWSATSGKDGEAYLFFESNENPVSVQAGDTTERLVFISENPLYQNSWGRGQGNTVPRVAKADDVTITVASSGEEAKGLQVMFIVDTTGSMSDELAYLQEDFASIAADVGSQGVEYSVNFYRDKGDDYVTRCNGFTDDVREVQRLLKAERADGGGDTPEAVADILDAAITHNGAWRDDCNKVAFLIFDAPAHDGTDMVLDEAIRSAAEQGIRLVPVVASNAERETELFARALAIMTGGTYVFLTDDSGVGNSHLEPIIGDYQVEKLHDVIVRIIEDNR